MYSTGSYMEDVISLHRRLTGFYEIPVTDARRGKDQFVKDFSKVWIDAVPEPFKNDTKRM